ncbi:hypothetical protein GOODEAATRI_034652, partial [Goodea atripinnis]
AFLVMASLPKEPLEDSKKQSFWMPGSYVRTVHRTDQSFQACNDIMACFMERAKVEKQYAQQLSQWSSKWKSIMDSHSELDHAKRGFHRLLQFSTMFESVLTHFSLVLVISF